MNGKIIAKRVVSMFVSDKGNLRLILLGTPSSVHVEIFILPITVANTDPRKLRHMDYSVADTITLSCGQPYCEDPCACESDEQRRGIKSGQQFTHFRWSLDKNPSPAPGKLKDFGF